MVCNEPSKSNISLPYSSLITTVFFDSFGLSPHWFSKPDYFGGLSFWCQPLGLGCPKWDTPQGRISSMGDLPDCGVTTSGTGSWVRPCLGLPIHLNMCLVSFVFCCGSVRHPVLMFFSEENYSIYSYKFAMSVRRAEFRIFLCCCHLQSP